MTKRKNRTYTDEFRKQAVELVLKEHYKVADAAEALNITPKILYLWISKYKAKAAPGSLDSDERIELYSLRKENKRLKMEKEILKKASAFFAKEMN